MRQRFLRDWNSGIKYRYSYNSIFICKCDPDLFPVIQMIQSIRKIIHEYFFYLKFISPDKDRLFLSKNNLRLILLDQNWCRLDIIPDQFYNIKPLHCHNIISKFKLIERQKFLYHYIHLFRFVHDDITVKITTFRIFIDIFLQTFRISEDQCDRCLQFMWNIGQKFFPHFINLFLFCNIFLQFIICCLQLWNRLFQPIRHLVHITAQKSNFIFVFSCIFCIEIKVWHLFGNSCKL